MIGRHLSLRLVFAVIALVSALALSVPGVVAQTDLAELPDGFLGTWTGTAEQVSPSQQSEYVIEIEMTGGEQYLPVGTVDYVGSNWTCGGSLVLWLVLDENRIAAGESITTGNDVCLNGGFVVITRNEDQSLSYEWRRSDVLDVATATLTRSG